MTHHPIECPRCHASEVPVYELAVSKGTEGHRMGTLHLAAHDCPDGGDHIELQPAVGFPPSAVSHHVHEAYERDRNALAAEIVKDFEQKRIVK